MAGRDCSSQLDTYITNKDCKISKDQTPFSESFVKRAGSTTSGGKYSPFPQPGGGNTSMGRSTAITKQSPNPNGDVTFNNLNSQREENNHGEFKLVESRGDFSISFSPNYMRSPINEPILEEPLI